MTVTVTTKKEEITPLTPRSGGERKDKDHLDVFEDLWRTWPREMRKQKPRAVRAWKAALKKLNGDYERIFDCLHRDMTEAWKDRKPTAIPYPSSWLNTEPWNDGDGEMAPETKAQPQLI